MSMANSIEMRVPFLDHRLVECLARVHPSEKFAGGWTKGIFRKAIEGLVPPRIQYRRDKNGFEVPEESWMRDRFAPNMLEVFRGHMLANELGFINTRELCGAYHRFRVGRGLLNGRHFFRVYAFETFVRRFADHIVE